jgi:hypothetical protein
MVRSATIRRAAARAADRSVDVTSTRPFCAGHPNETQREGFPMTEQPRPSVRVVGLFDSYAATALDHVLLGYDYLDRHDIDGYLSLVESDVLLCLPPERLHRGRAELEARLARGIPLLRPEEVTVVCPSVVVAIGRLRGSAAHGTGTRFVDSIVTGRNGLIRSLHRSPGV